MKYETVRFHLSLNRCFHYDSLYSILQIKDKIICVIPPERILWDHVQRWMKMISDNIFYFVFQVQ